MDWDGDWIIWDKTRIDFVPVHYSIYGEIVDILNQLKHTGQYANRMAYDSEQASSAPLMGTSEMVPMTVTELLDSQIKWHENKIKDLKAAKEAVSPDVERALNALAKL